MLTILPAIHTDEYVESNQTIETLYGWVEPTTTSPDTMRFIKTPAMCKDFLSDVIIASKIQKSIFIYGFSMKAAQASKIIHNMNKHAFFTIVFDQNCEAQNADYFLHHLKMLNRWEIEHGLKPTLVREGTYTYQSPNVATTKQTTAFVVTQLDEAWYTKTWTLPLFGLIAKLMSVIPPCEGENPSLLAWLSENLYLSSKKSTSKAGVSISEAAYTVSYHTSLVAAEARTILRNAPDGFYSGWKNHETYVAMEILVDTWLRHIPGTEHTAVNISDSQSYDDLHNMNGPWSFLTHELIRNNRT